LILFVTIHIFSFIPTHSTLFIRYFHSRYSVHSHSFVRFCSITDTFYCLFLHSVLCDTGILFDHYGDTILISRWSSTYRPLFPYHHLPISFCYGDDTLFVLEVQFDVTLYILFIPTTTTFYCSVYHSQLTIIHSSTFSTIRSFVDVVVLHSVRFVLPMVTVLPPDHSHHRSLHHLFEGTTVLPFIHSVDSNSTSHIPLPVLFSWLRCSFHSQFIYTTYFYGIPFGDTFYDSRWPTDTDPTISLPMLGDGDLPVDSCCCCCSRWWRVAFVPGYSLPFYIRCRACDYNSMRSTWWSTTFIQEKNCSFLIHSCYHSLHCSYICDRYRRSGGAPVPPTVTQLPFAILRTCCLLPFTVYRYRCLLPFILLLHSTGVLFIHHYISSCGDLPFDTCISTVVVPLFDGHFLFILHIPPLPTVGPDAVRPVHSHSRLTCWYIYHYHYHRDTDTFYHRLLLECYLRCSIPLPFTLPVMFWFYISFILRCWYRHCPWYDDDLFILPVFCSYTFCWYSITFIDLFIHSVYLLMLFPFCSHSILIPDDSLLLILQYITFTFIPDPILPPFIVHIHCSTDIPHDCSTGDTDLLMPFILFLRYIHIPRYSDHWCDCYTVLFTFMILFVLIHPVVLFVLFLHFVVCSTWCDLMTYDSFILFTFTYVVCSCSTTRRPVLFRYHVWCCSIFVTVDTTIFTILLHFLPHLHFCSGDLISTLLEYHTIYRYCSIPGVHATVTRSTVIVDYPFHFCSFGDLLIQAIYLFYGDPFLVPWYYLTIPYVLPFCSFIPWLRLHSTVLFDSRKIHYLLHSCSIPCSDTDYTHSIHSTDTFLMMHTDTFCYIHDRPTSHLFLVLICCYTPTALPSIPYLYDSTTFPLPHFSTDLPFLFHSVLHSLFIHLRSPADWCDTDDVLGIHSVVVHHSHSHVHFWYVVSVPALPIHFCSVTCTTTRYHSTVTLRAFLPTYIYRYDGSTVTVRIEIHFPTISLFDGSHSYHSFVHIPTILPFDAVWWCLIHSIQVFILQFIHSRYILDTFIHSFWYGILTILFHSPFRYHSIPVHITMMPFDTFDDIHSTIILHSDTIHSILFDTFYLPFLIHYRVFPTILPFIFCCSVVDDTDTIPLMMTDAIYSIHSYIVIPFYIRGPLPFWPDFIHIDTFDLLILMGTCCCSCSCYIHSDLPTILCSTIYTYLTWYRVFLFIRTIHWWYTTFISYRYDDTIRYHSFHSCISIFDPTPHHCSFDGHLFPPLPDIVLFWYVHSFWYLPFYHSHRPLTFTGISLPPLRATIPVLFIHSTFWLMSTFYQCSLGYILGDWPLTFVPTFTFLDTDSILLPFYDLDTIHSLLFWLFWYYISLFDVTLLIRYHILPFYSAIPILPFYISSIHSDTFPYIPIHSISIQYRSGDIDLPHSILFIRYIHSDATTLHSDTTHSFTFVLPTILLPFDTVMIHWPIHSFRCIVGISFWCSVCDTRYHLFDACSDFTNLFIRYKLQFDYIPAFVRVHYVYDLLFPYYSLILFTTTILRPFILFILPFILFRRCIPTNSVRLIVLLHSDAHSICCCSVTAIDDTWHSGTIPTVFDAMILFTVFHSRFDVHSITHFILLMGHFLPLFSVFCCSVRWYIHLFYHHSCSCSFLMPSISDHSILTLPFVHWPWWYHFPFVTDFTCSFCSYHAFYLPFVLISTDDTQIDTVDGIFYYTF